MSSTRDKFARDIKKFLRDYKIKPSQFGLDVLGDPGFVSDLDTKRDFRSATIDKVYKHMEGHRKRSPLPEAASAA
jgi:hypothetical protein